MVPFAIGTQTGGSTIRPASYCGIAGFKPTYGRLSTEGVLPFAPSLDTVGLFTHSADDMLALWRAMGEDNAQPQATTLGAIATPRVIEAPMGDAYRDTIARLRAVGWAVRSVELETVLARLHEAQQTVMFYEGADVHRARYDEFGDRLEHIAELVRKGRDISADRYAQAKEVIASGRTQLEKIYDETPVLLSPAATGPAPRGLAYTGDSSMNSPWTALGTPAITIPMPVGESLPLGLQMTTSAGGDSRLLHTAVALEKALG
jgi:Asp-tRNA(Asn)/Glu-tRNA(Gln) amidotransferase A subunit family amidase